MAWLVLFFAGLFEVGWAVGLKWSDGLTRLWPAVITVCAMIVSFVLLAQAVRTIPLGTAYVVWTGIGAVGSVIAGVLLFGESINPIRILWLTLIVIGILGLQATR